MLVMMQQFVVLDSGGAYVSCFCVVFGCRRV